MLLLPYIPCCCCCCCCCILRLCCRCLRMCLAVLIKATKPARPSREMLQLVR